ncbi:LysR substrate-binding domain-containing protein [Streptomyces sp. NPDC058122]|uniref:LysR substrate-binding domain-containing protein n=1 Tax=Streptomyces sp. NPDC058122 TaxID=3346349 RepID=UPI0036E72D2D
MARPPSPDEANRSSKAKQTGRQGTPAPADHHGCRCLTGCPEPERLCLSALRDDGWIMGTADSDPCDRRLTWACSRDGYEPTRIIRTDDNGVQLGFVAAGVGVALVPHLGLPHCRADIAIRPIEGPELTRQVGVAMLQSQVTSMPTGC